MSFGERSFAVCTLYKSKPSGAVPKRTNSLDSARSAMLALTASAGCASCGAPERPSVCTGRKRARCTAAARVSAQPWTFGPSIVTSHETSTGHRARSRRLAPSVAKGNAPGGFGHFGDFDRDRPRDGNDDVDITGGRNVDDVPTESGDFACKLSLELRRRTLGTEALKNQSDKDTLGGEPVGNSQEMGGVRRDGRFTRISSEGLLLDMNQASRRS
jgi:hypothetical protein